MPSSTPSRSPPHERRDRRPKGERGRRRLSLLIPLEKEKKGRWKRDLNLFFRCAGNSRFSFFLLSTGKKGKGVQGHTKGGARPTSVPILPESERKGTVEQLIRLIARAADAGEKKEKGRSAGGGVRLRFRVRHALGKEGRWHLVLRGNPGKGEEDKHSR